MVPIHAWKLDDGAGFGSRYLGLWLPFGYQIPYHDDRHYDDDNVDGNFQKAAALDEVFICARVRKQSQFLTGR